MLHPLYKTRSHKKKQSENKHKHWGKNKKAENCKILQKWQKIHLKNLRKYRKGENKKGKPRKLKNWVKIPNSRIREATERENRENERKKLLSK